MSDHAARGLAHAELREIYRAMCLTRHAEERLEILRAKGHVDGDVYRSLGQEAGAVGAAYALRRAADGTGDFLAPSVRAAGAIFLFGGEPVDFFRQYLARATGPSRGRETDVQWVDLPKGIVGPVSPLGTMLEVMAGITLAFRLRGEDRLGLVFYGDGASSTGAWHEGLCFAAAQRCPLILMVENNHWAFSTPLHRNTRLSSFTEKGPGYGIGAESVDGTDVLAVFDAVRRAATRIRAGEGTRLIELRYFRRAGFDVEDEQAYVDPAAIAEWEKKDPIDSFRARMLVNEWATPAELREIERETYDVCRLAAEQAVADALPEGIDALRDVYTDFAVARPWTRSTHPDPAQA